MDKQQLIDKVKALNTIDKTQLLGWLNALPNTSNKPPKPNANKVGDVYMHTIFNHPYVLLEQKDGVWICGLLTSEATCKDILEPCQSRFFGMNFFTKVIFTVNEINGSFLGVYENPKHLKKIIIELRKVLI
jgi:hypothetical protein